MSDVSDTRCTSAGTCSLADACAPKKHLPCIDISRVHRQKLLLCEQLEAIADSLPDNVDRMQCLIVASSLVPVLGTSHSFEEEVIFPKFVQLLHGETVVIRLMAEHMQDECAAQDITQVLLSIGHGNPVDNPEALGYMLRAFFDSLRRHIAFERDHLLSCVAVE